jgi:hypothetical protein
MPVSASLTERGVGGLFCAIWELSPGKKTPVPFFDALDGGTVISLKVPPGCFNDLPARYKDYVYCYQWFMCPKQLPDKAFRPVPDNRVPDLTAGGDAQPWRLKAVRHGETGHESAPQPVAALVDADELSSPTQCFQRL